jgi:acyl carrier protein
MSTRSRILQIASTAFSVPQGQIDTRAGWEDQQTDSFALVEVLVGVQEEFRIELQPADLRRIRNLEDMISLVEEKVATKGCSSPASSISTTSRATSS